MVEDEERSLEDDGENEYEGYEECDGKVRRVE
jgi:hypothetical protein